MYARIFSMTPDPKVGSLFKTPLLPTMDEESYNKVVSIGLTVASTWPKDTVEILEQRNPTLLEKLGKTEKVLESLLYIQNKPKQIKKEFDSALADFEKTASLCGQYAARHTKIGK